MLGTMNTPDQFDEGEASGLSSRVQAVAEMAGPSNLRALVDLEMTEDNLPPWGKSGLRLLGVHPLEKMKELAALASPISHIGPNTPPFFILHGEDDELVPKIEGDLLYAALRKSGITCQHYSIPSAGHAMRMDLPCGNGNLWDAVFDFFDTSLNAASEL